MGGSPRWEAVVLKQIADLLSYVYLYCLEGHWTQDAEENNLSLEWHQGEIAKTL